ncbi:MAG: hypothetical protein IPK98_01845 [Chloracidobacterium sp.]|nr:hypothetical protein [Chloracidobacterium sp.]
MVILLAGIAVFIFRRYSNEKSFITYIFLAALCVRLIFGLLIHVFEIREFVGLDSLGYDVTASKISDYWMGYIPEDPNLTWLLAVRGPGWGMNYLIGFLYLTLGKSIFVVQSIFAVVGAATIPLVYFCSERIFHNKSVARATAIGVAFFPPFIIWSGQMLKDGLIVFLLVLAMMMVLQIQRKFTFAGAVALIISLTGILSLRFYIFYMVSVAVVAGFIIGLDTSFKDVVRRVSILVGIGLVLIYFGMIRVATVDLDTYASFERLQVSRLDQATSGDSGFASDQDVSTVGGALGVLPIGFAYLMFAPFPWEMKNFRQSITLPDILLWWSMIPLLIYGLWYAIKHRLRASLPILIFTFLLTISYSVFQGNVGAAYRQRTQIQVFLFMFIAVGWGLIREKIEDKRAVETNRRNELNRHLKTRLQEQQRAT